MTDTVVARRYAGALFALGKQAGGKMLSQHGETFAKLDELIAATPELELALKSPVVSIEEKKGIMNKLLKMFKADTMMSNFCFLLADKERLASLRDIASCYGKLLDEEKGVIRGTLTTAVALDAKKQGALKNNLEKKAGKNIELSFNVDTSILGGVVLKVGDRVLDASLRAQLAILRETIKRGE